MRVMFLIFLIIGGCATAPACSPVEQEAISVCRAEVACGRDRIGTSIGFVLSGMGAGLSGQRNQSVDQYNLCVKNDLRIQRLNTSH